jgi:transposase-like protein
MEDETPLSESLKALQNRQNLENMINKVSVLRAELFKEMESYEILPDTAYMILRGGEVMICPKCNSPNFHFLHLGSITEHYRCAKCNYREER